MEGRKQNDSISMSLCRRSALALRQLVQADHRRPIDWRESPDDSWCFCVDYRRLNAVTRKDSYPLPCIDDALDHISGSRWFSSLDLRSGYWQVELAPDVRAKTAFTIGQGLWQFCVMPFGLCNAPATFERLEVFAAILQAGLRLNPKKCYDLRSFLDLASYYRRYVQDFATIARPIHRLTGRGQPYVWDDPCAQAFNILQTALITEPVLAYPDANRPFILDMDASNVGVGAVLSQQSDNGEQVIAYYSRALNKAEWNYCVTRWEIFAVVSALRHRPGRQHGNADALLRRPCTAAGCEHCPRQEARAQLAPTVATLRTVNGEASCLPLSPAQVQEEQERDAALIHVRSWYRSTSAVAGPWPRGRPVAVAVAGI
ncbi:hypothetical protein AAFF_G00216850 [Aldrovandia affinis]|uniref:ribonuclease H n=1 Tax=Aldrovandia affinis TaxID=143900 RepID=A0AAD7RGF3_9TELE|nr:hypothetical protein AAFF_G00216850 [Aldrovandia affinis]